jgi:hypothetical protein
LGLNDSCAAEYDGKRYCKISEAKNAEKAGAHRQDRTF